MNTGYKFTFLTNPMHLACYPHLNLKNRWRGPSLSEGNNQHSLTAHDPHTNIELCNRQKWSSQTATAPRCILSRQTAKQNSRRTRSSSAWNHCGASAEHRALFRFGAMVDHACLLLHRSWRHLWRRDRPFLLPRPWPRRRARTLSKRLRLVPWFTNSSRHSSSKSFTSTSGQKLILLNGRRIATVSDVPRRARVNRCMEFLCMQAHATTCIDSARVFSMILLSYIVAAVWSGLRFPFLTPHDYYMEYTLTRQTYHFFPVFKLVFQLFC